MQSHDQSKDPGQFRRLQAKKNEHKPTKETRFGRLKGSEDAYFKAVSGSSSIPVVRLNYDPNHPGHNLTLPQTEELQANPKEPESVLQTPSENLLLPDPPFKYSVKDSKKGGYWSIIRECYPVYDKTNNLQQINKIFHKMKGLNGGRIQAKAGDIVLVPQETHFQIPASQRKSDTLETKKTTQNRTPLENTSKTYTLTDKESLWRASQRLGINLHAWLRYNNLELPSGGNGTYYLRLPERSQKVVLAPGDTLKIPPQSPLYDIKKPKEEAPKTVTKPRKPVEDIHKPEPIQSPKQAPKARTTVNTTQPEPKTKQELAREIHRKYHHSEIAQEVKKHIRDKSLVQEVLNLQDENSKDNLAYEITQTLSDSELDKTPIPVLNLLRNTMQDSWIGYHQIAITRIEKALKRISQKLKEEEKKKNEPLYRLQELFKKPELSPEEIAQARQLIQKLPTASLQGDYFEKLQYKVPYFNQRDSEHGAYRAERMCNMSSMAMGLAVFGEDLAAKLKQDDISKNARSLKFKNEMQGDDIVEQIRIEHNCGDPYGLGQREVAKVYGYYFGGLEGNSQNTWTEHTGLWGNTDSYSYAWYQKNVIPELRKGNAITISIKSKAKADVKDDPGHIVHLLGVTSEGLYVHDPYAKTNLLGENYNAVMRTDQNTESGIGASKGKKVFWKFLDMKNAKSFYISTIKVLKK